MSALLTLRGLRVRFGGLTAVDGLDLDVAQGEIVSLIGPNGAGKTTVFNAITAIHPPDAGTVRLDGRLLGAPLRSTTVFGWIVVALGLGLGATLAVHAETLWTAGILDHYRWREPFAWGSLPAQAWAALPREAWMSALLGATAGAAIAWATWRRRRLTPERVARAGIARTFQNIRLFRELSVLDNLLVAAEACGDPGGTRELLAFVGLESYAGARAGSLPYGYQRRLEIARALATRPRLLLLDEPAAGMNPTESHELMQLIRRIRERGITILLIEHDMRVVMGISDRVVVLQHGIRIAAGTPAEVRSDARVIEAYLGREEA